MSNKESLFMYVSQWKEHGGAPGLGLFRFDPETGKIEFVKQLNSEISFNCSYVDNKHGMLYLCNEDDLFRSSNCNTGRVYGYQINPKTGDITEKFCRDTFCPNPSFVNFDREMKHMLVCHHSSFYTATTIVKNKQGEYEPYTHCNDTVVELFALDENGIPGALLDVKKHSTLMPDSKAGSKNNSHLNCIARSPGGDLFAVCDKGSGYVYFYRLDEEHGQLYLCGQCLTDDVGCSPRYCVFHPTLPYLFVNHEAAIDGKMNVSTFHYTDNGEFTKVCTVNTLPKEFTLRERRLEQQGFCIHPSGEYLYTLQHGNNAVGVLHLNPQNGELRLIQNISVEGIWPRGCTLSPDGRFLVTTCLESGDIAVYKVNDDGCLTPTGSHAVLKGSSYVSFYCP